MIIVKPNLHYVSWYMSISHQQLQLQAKPPIMKSSKNHNLNKIYNNIIFFLTERYDIEK